MDLFTDEEGSRYMFTAMKAKSLEKYLLGLKKTFLDIKGVISLMHKIAMTVCTMHQRKIIHRDLRMENILIKKGKKAAPGKDRPIVGVKITGFDLAFCFDKDSYEVR